MWVAIACLGAFAALMTVLWFTERARVKSSIPAPAERAIEQQTNQQIEFVKEEAERDEVEVMHADRDGLLARLRDRVRGKK